MFNDCTLVACGGYGLNKSQTKASLSWGLSTDYITIKGYGRFLLDYRLNEIRNKYEDTEVHLDTSQHTYRFFEKVGFKILQISKNGYGEGLDRYDMIFNEKCKVLIPFAFVGFLFVK